MSQGSLVNKNGRFSIKYLMPQKTQLEKSSVEMDSQLEKEEKSIEDLKEQLKNRDVLNKVQSAFQTQRFCFFFVFYFHIFWFIKKFCLFSFSKTYLNLKN